MQTCYTKSNSLPGSYPTTHPAGGVLQESDAIILQVSFLESSRYEMNIWWGMRSPLLAPNLIL